MTHKVLFVDDEPNVTESLKRTLRKEPYEVLVANSAAEGLEILARERIDVVVSDEIMPGMPGSEFLAKARNLYPETIRIILTGNQNVDLAIKAINEGEIYRFLTKPCKDGELAITIKQALQIKDLTAMTRKLLGRTRRQSAILQDLERECPGISRVERTSTGAIILESDDQNELEKLIEQIMPSS